MKSQEHLRYFTDLSYWKKNLVYWKKNLVYWWGRGAKGK